MKIKRKLGDTMVYFLLECGIREELNATSFDNITEAYICGIQTALKKPSAFGVTNGASASYTKSKRSLLFYVLVSLIVSSYFSI